MNRHPTLSEIEAETALAEAGRLEAGSAAWHRAMSRHHELLHLNARYTLKDKAAARRHLAKMVRHSASAERIDLGLQNPRRPARERV